MVLTFSVLDQKNAFWVNLVNGIKIVTLSWNLVPRLIWICGIQWCSHFLFLTRNTFLGKFGPKNQHCQFQLKFCATLIWICRIMWKISGAHFFYFRPEKPLLGKSDQKYQNCQFKLEFGIKTNLNIQDSLVMFTFSVFELQYFSWVNLVQKFNIVCSKWNLIQNLIQICKIQWWWLSILSVLDWK